MTKILRWSRLIKIYLIPSIEKVRIPAKTVQLLGSGQMQNQKPSATDDFQTQRILAQWGARKIRYDAPDYVMCKEFIDRANQAGIRIVILDMPVSEHTSSVAPSDYLEERSRAILHILHPNDFYLRFEKPLPDELYFDYSHLTVRGRSVFFRWMVQDFVRQYNGS